MIEENHFVQDTSQDAVSNTSVHTVTDLQCNTQHCSVRRSVLDRHDDERPVSIALRLAEQGYPVFPCRACDDIATGKQAKSPLTEHGFKDATTDDATIRSWWGKWPDAAIGMPTGEATGFLVLDLDVRDDRDGRASLAALEAQHGPLPATYRVRTPSGGKHLYFSMPEGVDVRCSSGRIGAGIDVRANGGYVLVPGSTLIDENGNTIGHYEQLDEGSTCLAEPPHWLLAPTNKPSKSVQRQKQAPEYNPLSWVSVAFDTLCGMVALAKPGERNDTLNRSAFCVGQIIGMGALTRSEAEDGLLAACEECGLGETEARTTIASGIEAGLVIWPSRPFFFDPRDTRLFLNVTAFLAWCGVTLRWNAFCDRYELTGLKGHHHVSDKSSAELWGKAREIDFRIDKTFLRDCLEVIALKHHHHPVRDYFDGLAEWDGTSRLDAWLITYLDAEDNDYTRAVGAKTLLAAVRRIKKPGTKFDQLLILEGEQGTGKSSALKILATRDAWFTDCVALTNESKVMIEQTEGKLIVEVPELKGMRKAEIEHVKATLSRTHDRARKAYGRYTEEVPRQFILVGTTNSEKGGGCWYLKDPTGNRRFWPIRTGEIDLERLERDREQLWAEAVTREAAGESIELPRELWQAAQREQEARMERDPWVEELGNVLDGIEGKLLTSDARLIVSRSLERWSPAQNERFGRAMRELGWDRTYLRHETGRAYFYVKGKEPWRRVIVTVESSSQVTVHVDKSEHGPGKLFEMS